jgi:antitoxin YefM
MDSAEADRAPVLVTRQGFEPVVLLAHSELESMMETLYRCHISANAARLDANIAELEAGDGVERTLSDL